MTEGWLERANRFFELPLHLRTRILVLVGGGAPSAVVLVPALPDDAVLQPVPRRVGAQNLFLHARRGA